MMAPLAVANAAGDWESVTLKVTLAAEPDTGVVGVPLIAPVTGFKVNPGGSVPELTEYVYGAIPPVADRLTVSAVPTVPLTPAGNVRWRAGGTAPLRAIFKLIRPFPKG